MPTQNNALSLPAWQTFTDSISALPLTISPSMLHGQLCGLLCADEAQRAENYLLSLVNYHPDIESREACKMLFTVFSVSQDHILHEDLQFRMMIPDDHVELTDRAVAFSDWCGGFLDGLEIAGVMNQRFLDEDSKEALEHIREFAELDYDTLDISEDDEKALMEVSEYTRIAVLRLHNDVMTFKKKVKKQTAH